MGVEIGGLGGGGGGGLYPNFTVPTIADFTQVNFGSATATQLSSGRGIFLTGPSNGAAQNWRILSRALPAASSYRVTIGMLPLLARQQFSLAGFGLRDSASAKLIVFKFSATGSIGLDCSYEQWTDPSTFAGASYFAPSVLSMMPWPLLFLRFEDDGANRILSWSTDGENFIAIHSIGRTDFLTPDHAFFGVNPYDQIAGCTAKHWAQGTT